MPFKTKSGTHYHLTYGCHGATISCDTAGLTPCSDCCGKADAAVGDGSGAAPGSPSSGVVAGVTVIRDAAGNEYEIEGNVIETRKLGAGGFDTKGATLYRLDTYALPPEQVELLDSLPGVGVWEKEWSYDKNDQTTAFSISDMGPQYTVTYAQTISELGIQARGQGIESADDIGSQSIAAWLASNQENDWDTFRTSFKILDDVEPIHSDGGDGWPARTYYPIDHAPDDYFDRLAVRGHNELWYGTKNGQPYIALADGYELVSRPWRDGTMFGVRKHWDTKLLTSMDDAEWSEPTDGSHPKGTQQARGVAYRTPDGDAIVTMTIEPRADLPGQTRTTMRIDDPVLKKPLLLISDMQSGDMDKAKSQVCNHYLQAANLGARKGKIRKAYQRSLNNIARDMLEADSVLVDEIIYVSDDEVEVRGLEAGYVPIRARVILDPDGKISSYRK